MASNLRSVLTVILFWFFNHACELTYRPFSSSKIQYLFNALMRFNVMSIINWHKFISTWILVHKSPCYIWKVEINWKKQFRDYVPLLRSLKIIASRNDIIHNLFVVFNKKKILFRLIMKYKCTGWGILLLQAITSEHFSSIIHLMIWKVISDCLLHVHGYVVFFIWFF